MSKIEKVGKVRLQDRLRDLKYRDTREAIEAIADILVYVIEDLDEIMKLEGVVGRAGEVANQQLRDKLSDLKYRNTREAIEFTAETLIKVLDDIDGITKV